MKPLSAFDAISPAFTRTHELLFHPFRLGRSWKLAAAQYIGLVGAAFIPVPLLALLVPASVAPGSRMLIALISLLPTIILFGFFYLGVRMQFVAFEMVVTRQQIIAPMWRRCGRRTWPWVWLKTLIGTTLFAAFIPTLLHRMQGIIAGMPALAEAMQSTFPPHGGADPATAQAAIMGLYGQMLQLILPLYAAFFLFFLLLKLITTTLEDFALPFYILDNTTLAASIRSGAEVIAADPVQIILYLVLKFVLSIIGFLLLMVASQVAAIPVGIVVGIIVLIGAVLFAALGVGKGSHGPAAVVLILGLGLLYLAVIAFTIWVQIFAFGYLSMLLESYAIYFLGGRYPRLGEYLDPPNYTFAPPPLPPSREERDNDSNDPPYPMDPALA